MHGRISLQTLKNGQQISEEIVPDNEQNPDSSAFNAHNLLYSRYRSVKGVVMVKGVGQQRLIDCSLKRKEGILGIYPVSGEYDFFMIVQAESFAELKRLTEDIQESHHAIKTRFIGRLR